MKINIEVDLSELYAEFGEEGGMSLSDQIKSEIIYRAKSEAMMLIGENTKASIVQAISSELEKAKESLIYDVVRKFIQEGSIKKRYGTNEPISMADYIKEDLERVYLSEGKVRSILDEVIKSSSNSISAELKKRYDLLFASQIVTKLNENGFLKEDVAKILLGGA